ncbi:LysM domain-containing lipoprotein [Desulfuromonas soudanensis]|uniref:LysM domain-containing lipoprotein n=1 Tax=Desulfuromonas soudanensis TaxID=1603606 RepID=A0A0M3QFL0_9BACT|nr:LysM peptidoglycan-binding domain-containing protein [Desulfuromonas soudanensis]ALC16253.1 LysM domain-containing lipoprotein [Desulfuromonas soudanensis]
MSRLFLILIGTSLLLAACAAPPRQELNSARKAVAEAFTLEAHVLAAPEYRQADTALQQGESLFRAGKYKKAREILSLAERKAVAAAALASVEREKRLPPSEERQGLTEILPSDPRSPRTTGHKAPLPPPDGSRRPPSPLSVSGAPAPSPAKAPKKMVSDYTVAEGETLWTIAARRDVYSDALLWPLIYKANRDQIKDPRQIFPGQSLTIPRDSSEQDKETAREVARRSDIFPLDLIIHSRPAETP